MPLQRWQFRIADFGLRISSATMLEIRNPQFLYGKAVCETVQQVLRSPASSLPACYDGLLARIIREAAMQPASAGLPEGSLAQAFTPGAASERGAARFNGLPKIGFSTRFKSAG
jgi:hypothetical protein